MKSLWLSLVFLLAAILPADAQTLYTSSLYHASGTWTPVLSGTTLAGGPTYTVQRGDWEQIGSTVIVHAKITTTALGGPTGNMQITGLPVTSAVNANESGNCMIGDTNGVTLDTGFTQYSALIQPNTTIIALWEFKAAGGSGAQTPVSDYAAATRIGLTCIYPAP